jgi:hypothetical protein
MFFSAGAQFAHAIIAIFTFTSDLDRFQNNVIGVFREKWIGRIAVSRPRRIHRVSFRYLTRQLCSMVASLGIVILSEAKNLRLFGFAVSQQLV